MNINEFLYCETPAAWAAMAPSQLEILLIDHANCEKKAASTALNLMYRYVDKPELLMSCSKLAREELRHFEQVLKIMTERGIEYPQISSARYAGELRKGVRNFEAARMIDILVISAIVEARSCERFEKLIPVLEQAGEGELAEFYASLLKSEARHFMMYLDYAKKYDKEWAALKTNNYTDSVETRIDFFLQQDQKLILEPDDTFRFHSGPPV